MDRYHFECIRKAEDAEAECLVMNNQEVRTKKKREKKSKISKKFVKPLSQPNQRSS